MIRSGARPLRLLFIPPFPDRPPWPGLREHGQLEVFPLRGAGERLGRKDLPGDLDACLDQVRELGGRGYDYIVGQASAFLWLPIFRLAGVTGRFALTPNYNHCDPYDAFVLALAAQFRIEGDVLFTGSRCAQEAFGRFGFAGSPHHAPGISLRRFRPIPGARERVRARLGIPADAPVLLYTGRLERDKAVDELIRAHYELKSQLGSFLIVSSLMGRDPGYVARCHALGMRAGNVVFLQDPPGDELVSLYCAADLFVLLGVSSFETFGRSPVEAMACGTPPVVPRYDGFYENIPETAGVLVPTHGDLAARVCDRERFVQSVLALLADRPRLDHMRAACRQAAEPFDRNRCMGRFLRLLDENNERLGPAPLPTATRWGSREQPDAFRAMSQHLEGQPLRPLLQQLLQTRQPPLDTADGRLRSFQRLWFSGYFPEPLPQAAAASR
jgi:glycosyltransferase involved in cell wall biosynthesis